MKRLVLAVTILVLLVALSAIGCTNKVLVGPSPASENVVSSCVTCHTDKDILKEVATEVVEEKSEETTGEG
jgi:cytochrome c553